MKFKFRYIIFLLILIVSCIEDADLPTDKVLRLLTVDGQITTNFGPHYIKLTRSARYGSNFADIVSAERFANVSIRDNLGNVVVLSEPAFGTYATPANFKGEVGRSYSIQIITADGKEYISFPETIRAVPKIDSLSVLFRTSPTSNPLLPKSGLEVYAHFKDEPSVKNFYQWRSSGLLQLNTRPDLFIQRPRFPAPKSCCDTCWKEEIPDKAVRIFSDRLTDGNVTKVLAAFVEDDGLRMRDKYMVRIFQQSLSENAFRFYRLVEQQTTIEGGIFDPPPATIGGNVIRLDDPEELVIGYFTAADVSVDSLFIYRSDLEFTRPTRVIPDDCREVPGATIERPLFW